MDAAATTIEREEAGRSAPPDWDHVPFDVGCARCGHDLRGLSDPKCPACQLEFDWSDAVPIEQLTCETCGYHLYGLTERRCPECGDEFDWDAVLLRYRRMQRPLFEYRWRDEPVRSLVRTWLRLWRPKKFWKTLDLHDPPSVGPLLVTWLISMLLYAGLAPLWIGTSEMVRSLWWGWGGAGRPWWLTIMDLPQWVLQAASGWFLWTNILPGVAWTMTSFAALLIFRQSMRRCKVKTTHVLRVWAYAVPQALPVAVPVFMTARLAGDLSLITRSTSATLMLASIGVFVLFMLWSLGCGYRYYLRMDRGWGVAIASQVIAVLGMMLLIVEVNNLLSR